MQRLLHLQREYAAVRFGVPRIVRGSRVRDVVSRGVPVRRRHRVQGILSLLQHRPDPRLRLREVVRAVTGKLEARKLPVCR